LWALREGSAWTVGTLVASALKINGVQILGGQEASIPDPTGGTVVDAEARMAIAALLGAARAHGLIAT
jgi:hypothetical protein